MDSITEKFMEGIRAYKRGQVEAAKGILFTAYMESIAQNRIPVAIPVTKEWLRQEGISFRELYQMLTESNIPLGPEAEAYFLNEIAFDIGRQGGYEEALRLLRRAADLNPNNADVWYNIGGFSFVSGNYEDALEAYTKVLSLEPNNENVKNLINKTKSALK